MVGQLFLPAGCGKGLSYWNYVREPSNVWSGKLRNSESYSRPFLISVDRVKSIIPVKSVRSPKRVNANASNP
jgi:hypothetical protein